MLSLRLRLHHLRLMELIEKHGSLRAVAEQLNLTQPAVPQMVKELELAFGATLGGHSVRGVTLIHPGRLALIGDIYLLLYRLLGTAIM